MKTIIFVGGYGSRMGSLTELYPKPMIRIGNIPILVHIMKIFSKQNYNKFILPLGYKNEVIKDYFLNFKNYNNNIKINMRNNEASIISGDDKLYKNWELELIYTGLSNLKASRLFQIKDFLDDETNFLTYGDGVADINLKSLLNFHKKHGKILTISGVSPYGKFGEIISDKNFVTHFNEKPEKSKSIINGGFMVFEKEIFKYIDDSSKFDFETDVFKRLIHDKQLMVYQHKGSWSCIDNERDVKHLNDLWYSGKAYW